MSHFFKTELGQHALQQRNIALNARQRRLLLLIDHEDFQTLDHDYKKKIAPTELVQQLIDMGLLAEQTSSTTKTKIQENLYIENHKTNNLTQSMPTQSVDTTIPTNNENIEEVLALEKLSFVEVQQVMIQTLTTYCGLMAKPLIQQIQQSKTISQLKLCQMQWITSLQESRIAPSQLNQTLKLINYSVQHL
ncbi:hypothetical protein EXE30_12640 [Acinetobacter halotolerans]|uniref:Uncharacterized protein n=1 Tax=Acinetobacter halotolerans TaxID=1752076 RepID=A0A4Q6XDN6_9GAMM|nr:hypothetical protein [Acinetobacter halotolerans]RZF50414.1 hypothetical protein EXE30_12640 [Acinetobacter halotolerans]